MLQQNEGHEQTWVIKHSTLCLGEDQVTHMEEERHDSREATRDEAHREAEARLRMFSWSVDFILELRGALGPGTKACAEVWNPRQSNSTVSSCDSFPAPGFLRLGHPHPRHTLLHIHPTSLQLLLLFPDPPVTNPVAMQEMLPWSLWLPHTYHKASTYYNSSTSAQEGRERDGRCVPRVRVRGRQHAH